MLWAFSCSAGYILAMLWVELLVSQGLIQLVEKHQLEQTQQR